MKIETKFDKGDNVVTIFKDHVVTMRIGGVMYGKGRVSYFFCPEENTKIDLLFEIIHKDESECFGSIDELCEYYKAKLAK